MRLVAPWVWARATPHKPIHDREQEAHGQATHQHAGDTLHGAQYPPHSRKNEISITDSRKTGYRKIQGLFPRRKTEPPIKPSPKQNLRQVQSKEHRRKPNNEPGGAYCTEPAYPVRKTGPYPINECGHPCALETYCERYENETCTGLADKVHLFGLKRRQWRLRRAAESPARSHRSLFTIKSQIVTWVSL